MKFVCDQSIYGSWLNKYKICCKGNLLRICLLRQVYMVSWRHGTQTFILNSLWTVQELKQFYSKLLFMPTAILAEAYCFYHVLKKLECFKKIFSMFFMLKILHRTQIHQLQKFSFSLSLSLSIYLSLAYMFILLMLFRYKDTRYP